jgi:hypothetical protein
LWTESRQKKPKLFTEAKGNAVPGMDDAIDSDATNSTTDQEAARPKTKSNAPAGFY